MEALKCCCEWFVFFIFLRVPQCYHGSRLWLWLRPACPAETRGPNTALPPQPVHDGPTGTALFLFVFVFPFLNICIFYFRLWMSWRTLLKTIVMKKLAILPLSISTPTWIPGNNADILPNTYHCPHAPITNDYLPDSSPPPTPLWFRGVELNAEDTFRLNSFSCTTD